jgi:hypothetical protein
VAKVVASTVREVGINKVCSGLKYICVFKKDFVEVTSSHTKERWVFQEVE